MVMRMTFMSLHKPRSWLGLLARSHKHIRPVPQDSVSGRSCWKRSIPASVQSRGGSFFREPEDEGDDAELEDDDPEEDDGASGLANLGHDRQQRHGAVHLGFVLTQSGLF
jgi:hypothetical protein